MALMETAGDDAMTTGTDGTKLCLSYSAVLTKQLRNPTDMDRQFAAYLIESLTCTIKENEDRTKLWTRFFHSSIHAQQPLKDLFYGPTSLFLLFN